MARTTDTLKIDVLLEVRKATKELAAMARQVKKGTDKMEKGFKKANRGINKMSDGMKKLRRLAVAAFSIALVRDFIKASNKQEDAINNLNAAMEKAGDFSFEASKRFQDLAAGIQKVTIEADENIISNIALMKNIGNLSNRIIPKATRAAIGLAKIMKVDTKTAFMLVGRAAAGSFELFTRYGIMLTDVRNKQKSWNELLKIGSDAFSLATAEARTGSGQMKQLGNTISDLKEIMGDAVKEGLIPFIDPLRRLAESEDIRRIIKGIGKTFKEMVDVFLSLPPWVREVGLVAGLFGGKKIAVTLVFVLGLLGKAKDKIADIIEDLKGTEFVKSLMEKFEAAQRQVNRRLDEMHGKMGQINILAATALPDMTRGFEFISEKTNAVKFDIGEIVDKFRELKPNITLKQINYLLNLSVKGIKLADTALETFNSNWRSLGETMSFVFEQAAFAGRNFFATLISEVNRLAQAIISRAAIFAILNLIPGVGTALRGPGQFILGNPLGVDLAGKRSQAPNISNTVTLNVNSSVNNASKKFFRTEMIPLIQGAQRDGRLKLNNG